MREVAATAHMWRRYAVDGWSTKKIAEEAGLSGGGVSERLTKACGDEYLKIAEGRKAWRRHTAPAELSELWRLFHDDGLTLNAVGKRVGMKPATVRGLLRTHPGYLAVLERRAQDCARSRHERNFAAHELKVLRAG